MSVALLVGGLVEQMKQEKQLQINFLKCGQSHARQGLSSCQIDQTDLRGTGVKESLCHVGNRERGDLVYFYLTREIHKRQTFNVCP